VTIRTSDAHGDTIDSHYVPAADAPRFLAPGESDSWTVDFSSMNHVTTSLNVYLHSTCSVTGWN